MSDRHMLHPGIRAGMTRAGLFLLWGLAPMLGLLFQAFLRQQDGLPQGPAAD